MKVLVELLAFESNEEKMWREVDITNYPLNMNSVFELGQNEFQPQDRCSVSMGDVIHWENEKHLIMGCGFKKLTEKEYEIYKLLPRRSNETLDRGLYVMTLDEAERSTVN